MSYNKKIAVLTFTAVFCFGNVAHAGWLDSVSTGSSAPSAPTTKETATEYTEDAAVTAKVKAALIADTNLRSNSITVNTARGVVKLTGNVDSAAQSAMATKDAGSVAKSVTNMLVVRAP